MPEGVNKNQMERHECLAQIEPHYGAGAGQTFGKTNVAYRQANAVGLHQ